MADRPDPIVEQLRALRRLRDEMAPDRPLDENPAYGFVDDPNEQGQQAMPTVSENNKPRNPIPEGTHHAVCFGVIDLGTQPPMPGSQFQKTQRKVMFMFEFPEERAQYEFEGKQVDRPRTCSKEFALSLHEKASLRKFLVAWRGKQFTPEELKLFDLAVLCGINAMIGIVHNARGYEDISSCAKLMKGVPLLKAENELLLYDIDQPVPQSLPEWVRNKIARSVEKASANGAHYDDDGEAPPPADEDNIPF